MMFLKAMRFDWTFSIGNVLTAAVLFIGFFHAHRQNIERLAQIEHRLNLIYKWFERKVIHQTDPE